MGPRVAPRVSVSIGDNARLAAKQGHDVGQRSRRERISMPKKRIHTEQAPKPVGPYSQAVDVVAGSTGWSGPH